MSSEWSKEIFSKNLRKYLNLSGKSQKELADVCGVSAPTFSDWLNGKKYPRIDKIQKMADYFGILKSDLIEEKGHSKKEEFLQWIRTEATLEDLTEIFQVIANRFGTK